MMEDGFWSGLAAAVTATGSQAHLDRLIDAIGSVVPHDLVTVVRYSAKGRPAFVKHRHFSDALVRSYLATYYVFDPFYAHWRAARRPGVLPLKSLADDAMKRGRYIAEFLARSAICDEVGVLLPDGGDGCLGIFLDRMERPFRDAEIALLVERYPVFEALHALHLSTREASPKAAASLPPPGAAPQAEPAIPAGLWPALSPRERELVRLILSGYPTATIARRLGITAGTVKNHRRRIYDKLDITTERELFVEFFQFRSAGVPLSTPPR
jgi:DNA-binding CsgD family transcriptional regulator